MPCAPRTSIAGSSRCHTALLSRPKLPRPLRIVAADAAASPTIVATAGVDIFNKDVECLQRHMTLWKAIDELAEWQTSRPWAADADRIIQSASHNIVRVEAVIPDQAEQLDTEFPLGKAHGARSREDQWTLCLSRDHFIFSCKKRAFGTQASSVACPPHDVWSAATPLVD